MSKHYPILSRQSSQYFFSTHGFHIFTLFNVIIPAFPQIHISLKHASRQLVSKYSITMPITVLQNTKTLWLYDYNYDSMTMTNTITITVLQNTQAPLFNWRILNTFGWSWTSNEMSEYLLWYFCHISMLNDQERLKILHSACT